MCFILYKEGGLRLSIYACYSWEFTLNICLDFSFHNMHSCEGVREESGEFINKKAYKTNYSHRILNGCYISL
jgi:hypothetical protein